jgi:hypothetical protein
MRPLRKRWLFTLCALVIVLASTEMVFRILGLGRARQETFYEDIFDPLTRMVPGAGNPYVDIRDFMNSRGLRGPDFDRKKNPGVFRIVCLGDSTTFGLGDYGNSYPKALDDVLNEGLSEKKYEVINSGIPGTGLYQQRLHFVKLFDGAQVDLVILMTGPNFRADLKIFRDRMKTPLFRGVFATQRFLSRSALYRAIRLRLKNDPMKRVPDDFELADKSEVPTDAVQKDYLEDLEIMNRLSTEMGFRLVLLAGIEKAYLQNLLNHRVDPHGADYLKDAAYFHPDKTMHAFAQRAGIPMIDIARDFLEYEQTTPELWRDPNHAGNLGNRLIATRVASELRALKILP